MPQPFDQPINAATRYCAVYGHPVRHSASPQMQNAGIAALGLNWRYLACEVKPDNLRAAIEGARTMNFIGLNLTLPHKLLAVGMVDVLDESAQSWGAVNTVCFEASDSNGVWRPVGAFDEVPNEVRAHGFNTDADAIARALRDDLGVKLAGATVLQLGAGGAGRTAALKLASERVKELFLVNRTRGKAEEVAKEIRNRYPEAKVTLDYPSRSVDLVLNTTSLGLKADDPLPLDATRYSLREAGAVYDMVYRPTETAFLKAARAGGCRVSNGLGMLLYQGAKALEIWSGQPAPVAVMRQALERHVSHHA